MRLVALGIVFFSLSVLAAAGNPGTPGTGTVGNPKRVEPAPGTKLLMTVPLYTQTTNYSCGAAAMVSLLAYYGFESDEKVLMKELGSTEKDGTDHHKMAAHAEKLGIRARVVPNLTLKDLADSIAKDQPVIVEAQAWYTPPPPPRTDPPGTTPPPPPPPVGPPNWPETWDQGHYMVVIGLDADHVFFVDPSLPSQRGYIPVKEFLDRWHDVDWANQKMHHTALLFDGTPKPLSPWGPIH